jgi:hypothetical protein
LRDDIHIANYTLVLFQRDGSGKTDYNPHVENKDDLSFDSNEGEEK